MDTETRVSQLLSSTPVIPDYTKKWSARGRSLKDNPMKKNLKTVSESSIILDIGQPNGSLSPLTSLKIQLSGIGEIEVESTLLKQLGRYTLVTGLPGLRQFLWDVQKWEHNPPQQLGEEGGESSNFDLTINCGITEAYHALLEVMMEEEDTVLLEDIGYYNFLLGVKSIGTGFQGVAFDQDGVVPEALEETLKNWDQQNPGKRMPKLLYTVSLASNPLGHNWSLSRMVEIYLICRKYDLLIMDDGAYHFLQFGERARSFQSLDVDGRVIRFDTFSKIIGAGYRLGWTTGPAPILQKINLYHQLTCQHTSFLTQAVIYSILKQWGLNGFEKRIQTVATFYEKQAGYAIKACEKHLSSLAKWTSPKGGMFMWVSLNLKDGDNVDWVVQELQAKQDIRVSNGNMFQTNPKVNSHSFRMCFSMVTQDEMDNAMKCLANILRQRTA